MKLVFHFEMGIQIAIKLILGTSVSLIMDCKWHWCCSKLGIQFEFIVPLLKKVHLQLLRQQSQHLETDGAKS